MSTEDGIRTGIDPFTAKDVALVCSKFGDEQCLAQVLEDWFGFIGSRPGQVVLVEDACDAVTRRAACDCFDRGMIDKLVLTRPGSETTYNRGHIGEHTAPALATTPYLLFIKIDTLPYRQGHARWLAEAMAYLERPDTFAVGGSFNVPSRHHEAWPGWYFSHKCSENFAFMKRETFIAALEEFAGAYISSGFRTRNPAAMTGQDRYLIEVAWERYIAAHQRYTLVRVEDPTWTIFHTNTHGATLAKTRERYLAREDITRHLNAGAADPQPKGCYYGRRGPGLLRRARVRLGASVLGPYWRSLKSFLGA